MANDKKKMEYQFTGDPSSLIKAVQSAIKSLDEYEQKVVQASNKAKEAFNKLGQTKFGSNVQKQISTMTSQVSAGVQALVEKFKPVNGALSSLASRMKPTTNVFKSFFDKTGIGLRKMSKDSGDAEDKGNRLSGTLRTIATVVDRAGQALSRFASKIRKVSMAFKALMVIPTLKYLRDSAKSAINYIEVLNMFEVAMDGAEDKAKTFVAEMREVYSLDPQTIMQHTATFYQLATAIDMPTEAARAMSFGLTRLSNDLSSLFNTDLDKAAEDMAAGLQGLTRAVRSYGLDLRISTLETTALSLGLKINADTTSEANRQGLRYITMVRQAVKATDDFGKTLNSPANQLRIMKEQFRQLARVIGSFFLPVITAVLPVINGVIMAVRTLLEFIAGLAGIEIKAFGGMTDSANTLRDGVNSIGSAADDASKKVKQLIAPFDELNVLSENMGNESAADSSLGGMDPRIEQEILRLEKVMDESRIKVRNRANEIRDSILDLLGLEVGEDGKYQATVDGYVDRFIKAWQNADYESAGAVIAEFMNRGISWGLENINWSKVGPGITKNIRTFNSLLTGFVENYSWGGLGKILGNSINIAIYSALEFISTFPWIQFGKALGKFFDYAITTIDWSAAVKTLCQGIIGVLKMGSAFLRNVDWIRVGEIVTEAILSLDWVGIFLAIGEFIYNSTTAMLTLLGTIGGELIEGILQGIVNAMSVIGTFVQQKIVDPFVAAVKKFFGIASPSKVMMTIGKYLIDGLFAGMMDFKDRIKTFGSKFIEKVKDVFHIHSPSKDFEEIGQFSLAGLMEGLSGTQSLVTMFQQILEQVTNLAKAYSESTITIFNNMYSVVVEYVSKIRANQELFTQNLAQMYQTMANISISAITNIISALNSIPRNITTVHTIVTKEISSGTKSPRKTPKMATGGVVTSPTLSLVGEGRYPEAVIPLDNSPQMRDLVQEIAKAVTNRDTRGNTDTPVDVRVFIGDREWDAFTYQSAQRGATIVGRQPIKRGE